MGNGPTPTGAPWDAFRPSSHDDEHAHDADVVHEPHTDEPAWFATGEHPRHPEVAGQPDPN